MRLKQRCYSTFLSLAAPLFLAGSLGGEASAAVLYFQGFESTAPSNAWSYTTSGVAAESTNTGSTDFPPSQRILEGSRSLQVNNGAGTVTFGTVDVSQYDSLFITIRLSSTSTTSGNGNDAPDYLRAFVALNGGSFAADTASGADVSISGFSNARWGYDATKTALTDAGTNVTVSGVAGTSTDNYSTIRINLPDSASLVALRLNLLNDNTGEVWNVDSISLSGTLAAPEPSKTLLLAAGLAMAIFRRRRTQPQ